MSDVTVFSSSFLNETTRHDMRNKKKADGNFSVGAASVTTAAAAAATVMAVCAIYPPLEVLSSVSSLYFFVF